MSGFPRGRSTSTAPIAPVPPTRRLAGASSTRSRNCVPGQTAAAARPPLIRITQTSLRPCADTLGAALMVRGNGDAPPDLQSRSTAGRGYRATCFLRRFRPEATRPLWRCRGALRAALAGSASSDVTLGLERHRQCSGRALPHRTRFVAASWRTRRRAAFAGTDALFSVKFRADF